MEGSGHFWAQDGHPEERRAGKSGALGLQEGKHAWLDVRADGAACGSEFAGVARWKYFRPWHTAA